MSLRALPLLLSLLALPAFAAPLQLSHQGRLSDAAGAPLTGSHTLTFRLYAVETGGASFWQEGLAVDLHDGFFHVTLGELSDLDPADFEGLSQVWLGLAVDSGDEMISRLPVVAVPYALHAVRADGLVTGATLEVGEIVVDGTTIVSSDGRIPWDVLDDVPPDTLIALDCSTEQVAVFHGNAWRCEDEGSHTHDASALTAGTVAVARLPVGSGTGSIAAGDHQHNNLLPTTGGSLSGSLGGTSATFSGALVAGSGSFSGSVGVGSLTGATATFTGGLVAGSITAGNATLTGSVSVGPVTGSTATFTGAVGVGPLTGSTATFTGAVGVGPLTGSTATFTGAVGVGPLTGSNATFGGTVDADTVTAADAVFTGVDVGTLSAADGEFSGALDVGSLTGGAAVLASVDAGTLTAGDVALDGTLLIGGDGASCTDPGLLRWSLEDARLEVCDGTDWLWFQTRGKLGDSADNPAMSCKDVLADDTTAESGRYWIDAGGAFAAQQLYCDMVTDEGGWTLTLKLNSSGPDVSSYFTLPTGHVTDWLTGTGGTASGSDMTDGLTATERFALWGASGASEYRVTSLNGGNGVVVDVTGTHTDTSNLMYHNAAGTPSPGNSYGNLQIPGTYRVLDKGTTNLVTGSSYAVVSHGSYACNCNESYRLDGDWNSGIAMWGDNLDSQPGRTNGASRVSHTAFWIR